MKRKHHFDSDSFINVIPGGIMVASMTDGFPIFFINNRMLAYLGYDTDEEFFSNNGVLFNDAIHPDDVQFVGSEMDKQLAIADEYVIEYRVRKKNGTWLWVHDIGTRITVDDEACFACICFDITKQREELNFIRHKASIDPLTNTLNREAFEERTNLVLCAAPDTHALLIIDLDDFKFVNDTYGHMCGDIVLQNFADNLRVFFRANDIIGRLGGDEFEVCLTNIQTESLLKLKLDGLLDLAGQPLLLGEVMYKQRISVGVAYINSGKRYSFAELYVMADAALYKAKQQGKNTYYIEVN